MINAKEEFLSHTAEACIGRSIKCAQVSVGLTIGEPYLTHSLNVGYSTKDLEVFLEVLNFEYNNGYGLQFLEGTVWYTDGVTWSSREEYDGSEWWSFYEVPDIPANLV